MMIKVRQTDCQLFAYLKENNQTSWKEFIARNTNGVLKSEIEFLYPRWLLAATVIALYLSVSRRSNFGYTDYQKLNNIVKTFLNVEKMVVQS